MATPECPAPAAPAQDLELGGCPDRASGEFLEVPAVAEGDSLPEGQALVGCAFPQVAVQGSPDLCGEGGGIER